MAERMCTNGHPMGEAKFCPECGSKSALTAEEKMTQAMDTVSKLEGRVVELERQMAEVLEAAGDVGAVRDELYEYLGLRRSETSKSAASVDDGPSLWERIKMWWRTH